jgi:hypothetical protein
VNLEPLLTTLDPSNLLKVFASLLVERRVIFSSAKLSTLSSCVQAAIALLYPLNWQHIYIPVLPKSLLTFCCAPMPFVVGVLESFLPEVGTLPMEQVLIVDLDDNNFLRTPADEPDYKLLPPSLSAPLTKTVTSVCKTVKSKYRLPIPHPLPPVLLLPMFFFWLSSLSSTSSFLPLISQRIERSERRMQTQRN